MVQVERKNSKGLWIREMMTKEWAEYMNLHTFPWTMKINCNLTVHLIARINLCKDGYMWLEINLIGKTKCENLKYTGQCMWEKVCAGVIIIIENMCNLDAWVDTVKRHVFESDIYRLHNALIQFVLIINWRTVCDACNWRCACITAENNPQCSCQVYNM